MPRASALFLLVALASPLPTLGAGAVVYPVLYEGGLPLSVGDVQDLRVTPGDTLVLGVGGLTVQEDGSVEASDGTAVDVSGWSFQLGGQPLTALLQIGQQPRFVAVVEAASCGASIAGGPLPAPIPVTCAQEAVDRARAGETPGDVSQRLRAADDFDPDTRCGYHRKDDLVTLCFDQHGVPYRAPAAGTIDDNDVIEVYLIVPENEVDEYSVAVQGTINDQDVRLLGADSLSGLKDVVGQLQALTDEELVTALAGQFGPFQAPSFTVTVTGPNQLQRATSFTVNPTYTAALRFAIGESSIRFNDFAVRQSSDGESTIQNLASDDGEAREYLNVVFFGWPWQERFWNGRDLRKPPASLGERINPMIGIGLTDIGDEYLAGISVELSRGLGAFVAFHYAQVEELRGGFNEGDEFSGDASTLPMGEIWEDDVTYGLSIDLRIAAEILGSLLGGS